MLYSCKFDIMNFFVLLHFVFSLRVALSSIPCDRDLSTEITKALIYRNNNSLLSADGIIYPSNSYWFENNKIFGCTCVVRNCLRKCCPIGYAKNTFASSKCERWNDTIIFEPPVHENVINKKIIKNYPNFTIIEGTNCGQYFRLEPHLSEEDEYFLLPDGSLYYGNRTFASNEYCFEYYEDVQNILPTICYTPDMASSEESVPVIYSCTMFISIPFFVIVIIVYTFVTELRNLHGRSLVCHVFSLLCAYSFLGITQLRTPVSDFWCITIAFMIYFSFLASFFWLNVMCIDLWWTFSGYRSFHGSQKERDAKKFLAYSLYAWGCPTLITIATLLIENLSIIPRTFIKPNFGKRSCWFDKDETAPIFLYFYLPISILLICNLLMFINTSVIIIKHEKQTKVINQSDSQRHNNEREKQRFQVYLKLFIVMGINWMMEVISWSIGGPGYLWYITDIGNTLQGVFIFSIFVCKKRVLRILNRKLYPSKNFFSPDSKLFSSQSSNGGNSSFSKCSTRRLRLDSIETVTSIADVHV